MRMYQELQARRGSVYFGIIRPELLEEDDFLLVSESPPREKKRLFGFLSTEGREMPGSIPEAGIDPTTLSRANKIGGRW